jgi:hypothetical protein
VTTGPEGLKTATAALGPPRRPDIRLAEINQIAATPRNDPA